MDITPIFVTGIIFLTLYKVIYLLVRRKERLLLIDKIDRLNLPPSEIRTNLETLTRDFGDGSQSLGFLDFSNRYAALRWGAGILGAGLGIMVGFFIVYLCDFNYKTTTGYRDMTTVYAGSFLVFIGLALLIAFMIELKLRRNSLVNRE